MKTGFINAYAGKPVKKRYSYHGFPRDCLTQIDSGSFGDYLIDVPYGPTQYISIGSRNNIGMYAKSSNYVVANNASSASNWVGWVGQTKELPWAPYIIGRHTLIWDTSIIPDNARIESGQIYLPSGSYYTLTGYYIYITNGMPSNPHRPPIFSDYGKGQYGGNGGQMTVGPGTTRVIPLNATGCSWINPLGYTKFMVRSSRDKNMIPPTGYEFYSFGGASVWQYLQLYYKLPL